MWQAILGILNAAGAGMQAGAQIQSGRYQSATYGANAAISDRLAELALERGRREQAQYQQGVRAVKGSQIVAFAENGIDLSSESALSVLADTAALGKQEAAAIRWNAEQEAFGHRMDAWNSRAERSLLRSSTGYNAAGTLLGGAGTILGGYAKGRK